MPPVKKTLGVVVLVSIVVLILASELWVLTQQGREQILTQTKTPSQVSTTTTFTPSTTSAAYTTTPGTTTSPNSATAFPVEEYLGSGGSSAVFNPADPAFLSVADGGVVLRLTTPAGTYSSVYVVVNGTSIEMRRQLKWSGYEMWYARVDGVGPFEYYFVLATSEGRRVYLYNTTERPLFNFDGVDRFPQVRWVVGSVGYQIFPDRFYNGDPTNDLLANRTDELWLNAFSTSRPVFSNWSDPITPLHCCHQYFGGDLKGITMKLGYLKSLGVDMIYLNPIFLSGSVHGYDTYDYLVVDPKYGTQEDLRNLIIRAHDLGIRVIFDFVPDHVGIGFWAFLDVYEKGPSSKYWYWFTIYKWPFKLGDSSAYRCWWGFGSLPQLNTTNPEVRDYLLNVALYWMDFGFDGMRIDTPTDLLGAKDFFRELRALVKSKYPQAYIVGEIWDLDPSWLKGDLFDSLMFYSLGRGILLAFSSGKITGTQAAEALSVFYASIGVNVAGMGFNVVDSHDTSRVLTDLGGGRLGDKPSYESIQRLKLLTVLQFTMPGMPVIFQGDERGALGDKNHFDEQRYPIQWGQLIPEVYNHYLYLTTLKHTLPGLNTSIIRVLYSSDDVLVYTRGYNDEVLVIANNGLIDHEVQLPEGAWRVVYPAGYQA
ncbi:glycoside hydrolase family 13 protein, partial [Desulfurococcus amylolyticus]|uniref:glycoside hydrolase family 13 protein n=1 Tax=Desulfurococcus amylolyticus TaxID=94694 RepID=UPI0023F49E05